MHYDRFFIDGLKNRGNLVWRFLLFGGFALAAALPSAGQVPAATLVDEFSGLNCEDVIARQDNLFAQLGKDSNATGYAIISADEENRRRARQIESMFHGQTEFRQFDDSRFKIIRAASSEGLLVQLWIVPAGADVPVHEPTEWDFAVDPRRAPFKINASEYDEGPCPIGSQFNIFSDYLKANRHARGHIVVWARTARQFRKEKVRIRRDLLTKYGIEEYRIKYFYLRNRSPLVKWEHWIVPGRIK